MPTITENKEPILVICLEGCHGSGKTQLTRSFEEAGHVVLDEGFLDMPNTVLHPQSLLMESTWVCSWFRRLVDVALKNNKLALIADRSPLSAVFYALRNGEVLEPMIRACIEEVREVFNIHIISVHLRTEPTLLWERIQARLLREPSRKAYREDKIEWMQEVLAFYDAMQWDYTVENNDVDITELRGELMASIAKTYEGDEPILHMLNLKRQREGSIHHVRTSEMMHSPSQLSDLLGESPLRKKCRTSSINDDLMSPLKRPKLSMMDDDSPMPFFEGKKDDSIKIIVKSKALFESTPLVSAIRKGPMIITPTGTDTATSSP